jgi:hypothetical protein
LAHDRHQWESRVNYYTAYEIGKLLSQLDYYLEQACLGVTWHEKQFRAAYDELHSKVRGVVILARDQEELQDQIARVWRKLNVDQFHSDDYCEWLAAAQHEIHEAVRDPDLDIDRSRTIRDEACGTFQGLVFSFIEDVRQIIESAFQQNPDAAERMSRSLSFGEFVSQALYPHEVYEHMYGPWSRDVWGRRRVPTTDHVIAWNSDPVNHPSGFGRTTERVEPREPNY